MREMAPGLRAPHAHRTGVPGALLSCWPETWEPLQTSGVQRKRPRNPRHLGAFRGISSRGSQGAPGPFPSRTRLGASGGPQSSWGPAALRTRGPPGGPQGRRGLGPRGRGPKERRGPCALGGTAAGPGAPGRWPKSGGPWDSAVPVINPPGASTGGTGGSPRAPGAPLRMQGHGGPRALRGPPGGPGWQPGGPLAGPGEPPGPPRSPPAGPGGPPGGPQGPLGDQRVQARIPRAPEVAPKT